MRLPPAETYAGPTIKAAACDDAAKQAAKEYERLLYPLGFPVVPATEEYLSAAISVLGLDLETAVAQKCALILQHFWCGDRL